MKSLHQLLRQPIKTLSGVLMVAVAVAILCVCVGQASAAANMRLSVEESYQTVALPTNKYASAALPEEVAQKLEELIAQNPEVVLADSHAGLASAYVQELHPDHFVQYIRPGASADQVNAALLSEPMAPYNCAMLEVTLESVKVKLQRDNGEILAELKGTVERVLGLAQGYNDPTGYGVYLYIQLADEQAFSDFALELQPGQRYLTYGMDYVDRDWVLRNSIVEDKDTSSGDGWSASSGKGFKVEQFTPENLFFLNEKTEEEWQYLVDHGEATKRVAYYRQDYIRENGESDYYLAVFTAWEMVYNYNKVSYTLVDYSAVTGDAQYRTPTLAKLEGTAEEFLASDEGALWREALENMHITNQSFPVVGVDDMRYVADFATQNTQIVQGRDFTDEELASGGRVCILSEEVARLNGVGVGDTITLQYYNYDHDAPNRQLISQGQGLINPTAAGYSAKTPFAGEGQSYTVVGIYRQEETWDQTAENLYAFTPNTIFTPKTAVTGEMLYADMGMFRTLVLKNGSMVYFQALLSASGEEGLFECYDQGYSDLIDHLFSYDMIAQQALRVGLVVYCVMMVLYVLLFPTRQTKTVATMASLGTPRIRKILFLNLSSLGVLIPGTLAGIAAGVAMRQEVIDALTKTAAVELPIEMDVRSLVIIGLGQLALMAVVSLIVSIPMTRNRSLMKRRGFLEKFKTLRKVPLFTWAAAILGLVISLVLCALQASNDAEQENYDRARLQIPVTVTVTNAQGDKSTGLNLKGWVADVLSGEFNWGLSDYLTDVRIEMLQTITAINGVEADRNLRGLMSVNCATELLGVTNSAITWQEGYDDTVFEGQELVCIVPQDYTLDADPSTPQQELVLSFYRLHTETDSMGVVISSREYTFEYTLTVVGTYQSAVGAQDIYCPYRVAKKASTALAVSPPLDSASATLKDNETLDDFMAVASKYFRRVGEENPDHLKKYALKVEVGSLQKAEAVLNNSIVINRISTYLVFILSAGAGFFLGFLMIRSRKRDIILMRTMGRANAGIYLEFAWEQMLRLLLGTAIGGAFFSWQPLQRLVAFVVVYFVGLSAALIAFLNSKLITNMKEDE